MTLVIERPNFEQHESDIVTVATTITLSGLNPTFQDNWIGMQFFTGADGETFVASSAGTLKIDVQHKSNEDFLEEVQAALDATAPDVQRVEGNLLSAVMTPTSLATATHMKLVVTQNRN